MIVEDVELRFVEREQVPPLADATLGVKPKTVRILQMRKLVRLPRPPGGPAQWTEWQDVPLVKE
jgi:hypothetical protein